MSGGDSVVPVRRSAFVEGCGESEDVSSPEISSRNNSTMDGRVAQGKLRLMEDGRPYVLAITETYSDSGLSAGTANAIARRLGITVKEVQEIARTNPAQLTERLSKLPQETGGCNGGGGSSVRTTGGGAGNGTSGGRVEGNARVSIDVGWIAILGLVLYRTLSASPQGMAASLAAGMLPGAQHGPEM